MASPCQAQPTNNAELARLCAEDRTDRQGDLKSIVWSKVTPRDEARQAAVKRILGEGALRTAADYLAAAMVYQHGPSATDIQMACSLASIGSQRDLGNKLLKWLTAASWDCYLMRRDRPPSLCTQYAKNAGTSRLELHKVDECAVTDEERIALNVLPLGDAKATVEKLK